MTIQPTVLLVEDSLDYLAIYQSILENEAVNLIHVQRGSAALKYLQHKSVPDIIFLDLGLPDMNGMEILKYVQHQGLSSAVVVVTVDDEVDIVVDAMRYGAFDFLVKPIETNRILVTIRNAIKQNNLYHIIDYYEKGINKTFHNFIGASEPMLKVYQRIEDVAKSDASVFITGETGTGKELCAQAIHKQSKRHEKPFFAINCAAIPYHLMESEIFGHIKGAFTGADKNREGAVSLANGGTLFLDEIGDMALELQAKLLRLVQTKTFHKVGSSQLQTVDIRFISATHRNIPEKIKAGQFRADLYHRLKVVSIKLPPLHKRGQDVLLLAQFFLKQYATLEQKKFRGFTSEADKFLLNYNWEGNVRQLQHLIHNVVVLNNAKMVTKAMLQVSLDEDSNQASLSESEATTIRPFSQVEKEAIIEAVNFCEGNVKQAAKLLKLAPATVYRKLEKYNIKFKRMVKSS